MRGIVLLFPLAVFAVQFATASNIIPSDVESKLEYRPKSLFYLGSVDGKSYFADNTTMTWNEADDYCNSMNMKLATITTLAQKEFLKNADSTNFYRLYWIGARESRKATELAWTATETDLSLLIFSELKDYNSTIICGAIDVYYSSTYMTLNFALCTNRFKVLCEV